MSNSAKSVLVDDDIEALLDRIEQTHTSMKKRNNGSTASTSLMGSSQRQPPADAYPTSTPSTTPRILGANRMNIASDESTSSSARTSALITSLMPKMDHIRESVHSSLNEFSKSIDDRMKSVEQSVTDRLEASVNAYVQIITYPCTCK